MAHGEGQQSKPERDVHRLECAQSDQMTLAIDGADGLGVWAAAGTGGGELPAPCQHAYAPRMRTQQRCPHAVLNIAKLV